MGAGRNLKDAHCEGMSLVDAAEPDLGGIVSPVARETLTDAIRQDLDTKADSARVNEARIVKIETQTRVLAEALIAISDPTQNFAIAVQAVKEEM